MKISVDGGSLCAPQDNQFGNYTFSKNLLKALRTYDVSNDYTIYTFCNIKNDSDKKFFYKKLLPKIYWSKLRIGIEEFFNKKNIYLALNQSIPVTTFARIIGFSHGLSFKFYPGLYKNYSRLNDQLEELMYDSDKIIVSSQRVMDEMLEIDDRIAGKINVLPYGLPFDMEAFGSARKRDNYFLHVAADHPIKNTEFILKAFKILRHTKSFRNYKLYLAGFPEKVDQENVKIFPFASRKLLKDLYRKASLVLTTSFYESFNMPVLEALSQGTSVVGLRESIVPELRSYVRLADDMAEFIELVKKTANKKFVIKKEFLNRFSWKNYVKKLLRLY